MELRDLLGLSESYQQIYCEPEYYEEDLLVSFFIDEGYVETEEEAFELLEYIDDELFDELCEDFLTENTAEIARLRRQAQTARQRGDSAAAMKAEIAAGELAAGTQAKISAALRDKPSTSTSNVPQSTSKRTAAGAELPSTGRRPLTTRERRLTAAADKILKQAGPGESGRPISMTTNRGQGLNISTQGSEVSRTMGGRQGRGLEPGQSPMQAYQDRGNVVNPGERSNRRRTRRYSPENNPPER